MSVPYDPPIEKSSRRGRSTSFSASSAPSPSVFNNRTRRQSLSSVPTSDPRNSSLALSDDEADHPSQQPLIDLEDNYRKSWKQDPADAAADRALQREGRQSKVQRLEEEDPNYHATGDMEQFMAQLYDLTHTIDALDNDIDEIVAMRNKIVSLKPSVDVGQVSLQADLKGLAALTTDSGKRIVSLETWLLQLHKWSKEVKKLVKSGQAGETMKEVGEIKFQLANAKLDFAAAMERIREGAYKEQQKRERTRIWMARHIRSREPEIEDKDVKGLLKAAELGAADGVAQSHVTSYAGLWALQNPFTELAELTDGMRFLHDELDREIVDQVTGKNQPKRIIYLNGVYSRGTPKSSASSNSASIEEKPKSGTTSSWFASRMGLATTARPARGGDNYDGKMRYIQAQMYASEKDLEYGFARQQQLDRMQFRKKMVIALLLVVIAALILFVSLATMKIPSETSGLDAVAHQDPSSTFAWGDSSPAQSPTVVATNPLSDISSATPSQSSLSQPETDTHSSKLTTETSSTSSGTDLQSSSQVTDSPSASSQTRNIVTFTSSPQPLVTPGATLPTQTTSMVWWQAETTQAVQQAAQGVAQPSILPAGVVPAMPVA
ncbi:hypothetical protein JCM5353_002152 [Sporobolomyces roseus]